MVKAGEWVGRVSRGIVRARRRAPIEVSSPTSEREGEGSGNMGLVRKGCEGGSAEEGRWQGRRSW